MTNNEFNYLEYISNHGYTVEFEGKKIYIHRYKSSMRENCICEFTVEKERYIDLSKVIKSEVENLLESLDEENHLIGEIKALQSIL